MGDIISTKGHEILLPMSSKDRYRKIPVQDQAFFADMACPNTACSTQEAYRSGPCPPKKPRIVPFAPILFQPAFSVISTIGRNLLFSFLPLPATLKKTPVQHCCHRQNQPTTNSSDANVLQHLPIQISRLHGQPFIHCLSPPLNKHEHPTPLSNKPSPFRSTPSHPPRPLWRNFLSSAGGLWYSPHADTKSAQQFSPTAG